MEKSESIWTYDFIALFLINCVTFFGQTMVGVLLPKYLSTSGYGTEIIGIVISTFSMTALFTRPITGSLIDAVNKKSLYIITLVILAAASFGYSLSASIPMIIVFRLVHGFGLGCNAALGMTMAADVLPREKLSFGIGVFGMSSVLAMAFGPGLGLFIAERYSYTLSFCITGALSLISIIIASRMRTAPNAKRMIILSVKNILAKECVAPACFMLLLTMVRTVIMTYLVIYITEVRMISGITVYFIINAAALLIFQPLMGRVSDKLGIHISLATSFIFIIITLVVLAYCAQTWHLLLAGVFHALGIGVGQSQLQALTMKIAAPERRGIASSTVYTGIDIGDLTGPMLGGFVIARWSYETMFMLAIIPIGICAVAMIIWLKGRKGLATSTS